MAGLFFRVGKGIELEGGVVHLTGNGVPGGGDADLVGVGSTYTNNANGDLYVKDTAGAGSDKWERQANATEVAAVNNGISWREPVAVHDSTNTTLAAVKTDADADDTLDGVVLADQDRVLISGLSAENNNVYIVTGSTGNWTFTEDTNTATAGDTVYVEGGTDAGKRFTYSGSAWVATNQADLDELGFLRTFVGKTAAGSETPTYTSQNYITNGDNLEVAAGKLDAQVKANTDAIGSNDTDITALQSSVSANTSSISTIQTEQTTQNNNISTLQTDVGNLQTSQATQDTNITNAQNDATTALNRVGDTSDYSSNTVVTDGDSAATAIGKLDAELAARVRKVTAANVTTATNVDSVSVDAIDLVEWKIVCTEIANPANKESLSISALHDGTASVDAANVDYTEYARLDVGATIDGLLFDVVLSGTGAGQQMHLEVTSTDAVDVEIVRIAN